MEPSKVDGANPAAEMTAIWRTRRSERGSWRGSYRMPIALTIAGSDSGGGAGIQADLKTFAALGVYGTSASPPSPRRTPSASPRCRRCAADLVTAQIEAVAGDMRLDAVKTGMLRQRRRSSKRWPRRSSALELPSVVVDPVMIAKSGDRLFDHEALAALRSELLPLARLVTPNMPEAEVLADMTIASLDDAREAARRIHKLGAGGGHRERRSPARRRGDRRAVRRPRVHRIPRAADRHPQHARHGLHLRLRDRRASGASDGSCRTRFGWRKAT